MELSVTGLLPVEELDEWLPVSLLCLLSLLRRNLLRNELVFLLFCTDTSPGRFDFPPNDLITFAVHSSNGDLSRPAYEARQPAKMPVGNNGSIRLKSRDGDGTYWTLNGEYAVSIESGLRIPYSAARKLRDTQIFPPKIKRTKLLISNATLTLILKNKNVTVLREIVIFYGMLLAQYC